MRFNGYKYPTLLWLFLLSFLLSCTTRKIHYNRNKIIKKFGKEYKIYLNDKLIKLDTIFLNISNVETVSLKRKTKYLNIYQKNKQATFSTLYDIHLSSQKTSKSPDTLICVIDGILTDTAQQKSINIEDGAIKDLTILKHDEIAKALHHARAGALIITIK
jgi:hypothetical protein